MVGSRMPSRIAMIPMTTRSSTSVNARRDEYAAKKEVAAAKDERNTLHRGREQTCSY
jgi:hypothetical protein